MKANYLIAVAAVATLAGCAKTEHYNWGDYQSSLYDYYADKAGEADYVKSLDVIIADEAKGKKTPPGIYAEAGFMALSRGDSAKAIDLFTREKTLWPESTAFMDKAIANARNGKSARIS